MKWANPSWFNGFWLVAMLVFFLFWSQKERYKVLRQFIHQSLWGRLVHVDRRRQRLKLLLVFVAIFFFILGLARPQRQGDLVKVERQGIDVMVILDASTSMLAGDFKPNRFVKAKREISSLVNRLKGDRIGIVVFSGVSFVQCPLTLDYRAAKLFLEAMQVGMLPRPGTVIGDAIRTAIRAFDPKKATRRVILLITDGEDHESHPEEAAEQAKAMDVKIYCIGVGKPEGEPIPILDENNKVTGYKKDEQGNLVLSRLGEMMLQQVALTTGGAYYRATAGELELDRIYNEIEKMEKQKFEEEYITKYEEQFFYFLWIVFLLLCIELIIGERKGLTEVNASRLSASVFCFLSLLLIAWKSPVEHRNAKANELYQKQDYDQALQIYRDAQSDAPDKAELHYNVGNTLYQQKNYQFAKSAYQQAITASNPGLRANTYYNLASAYFREGQLKESLRLFEKALELNPKDEDTRYNIELIKRLLEKEPPPEQKQQEQHQQQEQQQKQEQQEKKDSQGGGQGKEHQEKEEGGQKGENEPQKAEQEQKTEPQQSEASKEEQEQSEAELSQSKQEKQKEEGGPQKVQNAMSLQDAQRVLDALEEQPSEVGKLLRYHYPKTEEAPPGKDW